MVTKNMYVYRFNHVTKSLRDLVKPCFDLYFQLFTLGTFTTKVLQLAAGV